ncbi:FtsW/RodA/SpoVE family cell cycle protein [bacterium D16-51]|nr:FtsW/RodA/SpoVE family cell cycle protein [bacterium D16-59]RKI62901.1 FtsW/RodA/SpoVE family cell cycle protein [bacterium D16-51]
MFGSFDAVGVAHSIVVEVSKYVIILLFAVYTWHCFTVFFGKNAERKDMVYRRQNKIMYAIHFICSLVLFLNSLDWKIALLYLAQLAFLFFVNKAYLYVYKNASKLILNNMLMLLMIGFVMLGRIKQSFAVRQLVFAAATCLVGLFIPLIIEKFHSFDRFGKVYAVLGICMLALVFVIGKSVYGAKNWIVIAGFAMQPSEFVKIIYVFFIAAMLARASDFRNVLVTGAIAGVHVLILVAEKDLGAALIYYFTFLAILYVATRQPLYLAAGFGAGTAAAIVAWKFFTHVQKRVTAWQDPWGSIDDAGYQVAQSLFAIGTGGWFGMGLGEGLPSRIPVAESDFIFSAISEELGAFFAICLILVEVSCFILFINIALKMARRFYKLTALGLAVEYIFQVFLTIGGVTKFIPSTGVTLPLVSYGGSSVISTIILFCIIQGMYVLNCREEEKIERETAR